MRDEPKKPRDERRRNDAGGASQADVIREKLAAAAEHGYKTDPGQRKGLGKPLEEWTKSDLYRRARALGVKHRSSMDKKGLIKALREAGVSSDDRRG